MSQQTINNTDVSPDSLKVATTKINSNFTELYSTGPDYNYTLYEDFDMGLLTSGYIGRYGWKFYYATGVPTLAYTLVGSTFRGAINMKTSGSANGLVYLYPGGYGGSSSGATDGNLLGTDPFTLMTRIRINQYSNAAKSIMMGLIENYDTPTKGIYFTATNAGTWQCVTHDGTPQTSSTSTAQTASWVTLKIVSTGSSVGFYINNALVATNTTHIPNTGMKFYYYIKTTETVTKDMDIDYFYITSPIAR